MYTPSHHRPAQALAEVPNAVAMGLLPSALLDTALFRLVSQQMKLGVYDPHDGRCACLLRLHIDLHLDRNPYAYP